jgi:hypothetical protein
MDDTTTLMLSMLFGALGFAFLIFGKKSGQVVPMFVGLALMVFPYFIPNITILLTVCIVLTAIPFLVRSA